MECHAPTMPSFNSPLVSSDAMRPWPCKLGEGGEEDDCTWYSLSIDEHEVLEDGTVVETPKQVP